MEQSSQPVQQLASGKMLRAMVGIGVLCALLIVLTYEGTRDRVTYLKQEALEKAILEVIPGAQSTRKFRFDEKKDRFFELTEPVENTKLFYAGYDEHQKLKGIALDASGQGYADIIRILYGYAPEDQAVVGFYVLETKETPGLGDKIEKDPNFLENFHMLDVRVNESGDHLLNRITTVKSGEKSEAWQIDGITGATISSRAIGDMLDVSSREWVPILRRRMKDFSSKSTSNE